MAEYVACKECGFKMNIDFPLFDINDLKKHNGLCMKCWQKHKSKKQRELKKIRREKRVKRVSI